MPQVLSPQVRRGVRALKEAPRYSFGEWRSVRAQVPATCGVYAIWSGRQFLYVGVAEGAGLRKRLGQHASGSRADSAVCMWVYDRCITPTLTTRQLQEIGDGNLIPGLLVKREIDRFAFRFVATEDGPNVELAVIRGAFGPRPKINRGWATVAKA